MLAIETTHAFKMPLKLIKYNWNVLTTNCSMIPPWSRDIGICCLSISIGHKKDILHKNIRCKNKTTIAIFSVHTVKEMNRLLLSP